MQNSVGRHKNSNLTGQQEIRFWLAVIALVAFGAGLFIFATPHGLELVNDSVNYIDGARNLLAGNGYSRLTGGDHIVPITNFPPFYSIVLSAVLSLGIDPIRGVWWLSLVFYLFNLALIVLLGRQISGSRFFGLVAMALFLLSQPFLRFHTFALTEPLFLFNYFMAILLVVLHIKKQRGIFVVMAGVFASLAYLTRYIGISLYVTSLAALFVFIPAWRKRWTAAGLFLLGGLPGLLLWSARNMSLAGNATNRQFLWHAIPAEKIQQGVSTVWGWLLPDRFHLVERFYGLFATLTALSLLLSAAWLVWTAWRRFFQPTQQQPLPKWAAVWFHTTQIVVYFAILTVTLIWLDASVNYEARILMPMFNSLLLILIAAAAWVWRRDRWWARIGMMFAALAIGVIFLGDTISTVKELRLSGQGYASSSWVDSETIRLVKETRRDKEIYSNRPQAINLLTGRGAYILPSPINPATGLPRENYEIDIQQIRERVETDRAVVVVFYYEDVTQETEGIQWMHDLATGLKAVQQIDDDLILGTIP